MERALQVEGVPGPGVSRAFPAPEGRLSVLGATAVE